MRLRPWIVSGLLAVASPAAAQFNAYYAGTQLVEGRKVDVTTQYSVDSTRVAAVFKGPHDYRMLYTKDGGVLRMVDDGAKSWFEMARDGHNAMSDAMAQMQQQLASMPPEQRQMAEKMMGGAMPQAQARAPDPDIYVQTDEQQTVKGYACRRVNVMRGQDKRSEYWGASSPDFELSPAERAMAIGMHDALHSGATLMTTGGAGGGALRPFEWDTQADGYPLITRCFDGGKTTLDLHLTSFDRKPLDDALFELPKAYHEQKMDAGAMGGHGHTR